MALTSPRRFLGPCFKMAVSLAVGSALELLFGDDDLDYGAVRTMLERYCVPCNSEGLAKAAQVRWVLRLLREEATKNKSLQDALRHLASLAAWSQQDPAGFGPGANLQQICPPADLVLRARPARRAARHP